MISALTWTNGQLLASLRRIGADQVEWIVRDAVRRDQVVGIRIAWADGEAEGEPWTLLPSRKAPSIEGPFPKSVEIVRSNVIFIPKEGLSEPMLNRIIRIAAFQNPEFYKTQAMRLSTWDKPRIISVAKSSPTPCCAAGNMYEVTELSQGHGIQVSIRDERCPARQSM
jgi:hypothetical protein